MQGALGLIPWNTKYIFVSFFFLKNKVRELLLSS